MALKNDLGKKPAAAEEFKVTSVGCSNDVTVPSAQALGTWVRAVGAATTVGTSTLPTRRLVSGIVVIDPPCPKSPKALALLASVPKKKKKKKSYLLKSFPKTFFSASITGVRTK